MSGGVAQKLTPPHPQALTHNAHTPLRARSQAPAAASYLLQACFCTATPHSTSQLGSPSRLELVERWSVASGPPGCHPTAGPSVYTCCASWPSQLLAHLLCPSLSRTSPLRAQLLHLLAPCLPQHLARPSRSAPCFPQHHISPTLFAPACACAASLPASAGWVRSSSTSCTPHTQGDGGRNMAGSCSCASLHAFSQLGAQLPAAQEGMHAAHTHTHTHTLPTHTGWCGNETWQASKPPTSRPGTAWHHPGPELLHISTHVHSSTHTHE